MKDISLRILDMECAACVARVRRAGFRVPVEEQDLLPAEADAGCAVTLMLCLQRATMKYHKLVQERHIWDTSAVSGLKRIEGQTLGIVGLGRIGQSVAKKAHGFDMRVIAYDPFLLREVAEKLGVRCFSRFSTSDRLRGGCAEVKKPVRRNADLNIAIFSSGGYRVVRSHAAPGS